MICPVCEVSYKEPGKEDQRTSEVYTCVNDELKMVGYLCFNCGAYNAQGLPAPNKPPNGEFK